MIETIFRSIYLFAILLMCNTTIAHAADDADSYINKRVLITITVSSDHHQTNTKRQIAAKIIRVEDKRIVLLPYGSRVEFGLPPDPKLLIKAKRGVYMLENGNVSNMANPDYVVDINLESNSPNVENIIKHGYVP
jgi:hypothetical protein